MMRDGRRRAPKTFRKVLKENGLRFPGGELEGPRPKGLCPACRLRAFRASASQGSGRLERRRTRVPAPSPWARASSPYLFPVLSRRPGARAGVAGGPQPQHRVRGALSRLAAVRAGEPRAARAPARGRWASDRRSAAARFADKRRHAQIAARHALDRIAAGLRSRGVGEPLRIPRLSLEMP